MRTMQEGKPSPTAEAMALVRAVETSKPESIRVVDDPYAHWFLGPAYTIVLGLTRSPLLDALVRRFYDFRYPGLNGYVMCRHRQMDEWLVAAADSSVDQVILLGAGYDTRFIRFGARLAGARRLEMDHPATQSRKRKVLQARTGTDPSHVELVSIDLADPDPMAALEGSGFESGRKNVFVLEGLTYYIDRRDVEATLGFIKERSAPGSVVIFDYLYRSLVEGTCELDGARKIERGVRRRGEPFVFGLDLGELEPFIEPFGFRVAEELGGSELRARFLGDRPLKIYPFARLAVAEVV
ncbi:MAG: class I SAM-dependent methyltransferase [bacterium]|nr:class I SAM-dependent methyltransferase [bacterium]